jgi:hypothetical protein
MRERVPASAKQLRKVVIAAKAIRDYGLSQRMILDHNGFPLRLSIRAHSHGRWIDLPLNNNGGGCSFRHKGIIGGLALNHHSAQINYALHFTAPYRTRLRLQIELPGETDLFHLIPGNIHGDNNAAHVRSGEFPCLTMLHPEARNCAPLWEFRADRASHPVSILCCDRGAVGISIDPYSSDDQADDGFIRNGLFAALPNACGVSLGYGNDPLTFQEKTVFLPATSHLSHGASASGSIHAIVGAGRSAAHAILRTLHRQMRELPSYRKSPEEALHALANTFAGVNWSHALQQYTNRKCRVPVDTAMQPWRAIVEIGWTGGSMMAYPFALAEHLLPGMTFPKGSSQIFDEICTGFNKASGFLNDTAINRFTRNRPEGWNSSTINGWWSGFLPLTQDNHCAYTNAHAAYYLLRTVSVTGRWSKQDFRAWIDVALRVLNTAVELQREDGAFGYIFSSREKKVIDWDGFAGCWFAAALVYAWKFTGERRYLESASRALDFYWPFVRQLNCWGTPMDTCKSVDSEGNLAFIRAARLLHEFTGEARYLDMLADAAAYEYLWRYAFRTRPQCPPLKGSNWNSCGGSLTSVSNPHIHPMSAVVTEDLKYLAKQTGDVYHQQRADEGLAWLMNTMELYPAVMGYGCYGMLSERTCPSDGLLAETFADDNAPASTWWSYNAWAAASAMEAIAEHILNGLPR